MKRGKIYNIFYLIIFILPLFLFFLFPIRGVKEKSITEARMLEQIPKFQIKNFLSGEYQDRLEKGISDQLLLSQTMRKQSKRLNTKLNDISINFLNLFVDECKVYTEVDSGYYNYGCSNYLIEKPSSTSKYNFKSQAKYFNNINADKYIYFIEKDRSINFNFISEKEKIYESIKNEFNADRYGRFELNSFDDLKKYFYQTDHHWNYRGSYKGYTEIVEMLLGKNETVLEPIETVEFDTIFFGTADRKNQTKKSTEKFTVYKFKDLKSKVYINGKEKQYSNMEQYYQGNYSKKEYINHYAKYYGDDYAEVIFDFSNPNKQNLLVLCTSYSNAIKQLLASHFNKTYYIDLRHNKDFKVNEYIEENDIDKVLLLGDIYSFIGGGE